MAAPYIAAVDVTDVSNRNAGLSDSQLQYSGTIYAVTTESNLEKTYAHLKQNSSRLQTCLNVTSLPSIDTILDLLNDGASKVFATRKQIAELRQHGSVAHERLVLASAGQADQEVDTVVDDNVGIFLQNMQDADRVESLLSELGTKHPAVFISLIDPTPKHVFRIAQMGAVPIIPANMLTMDVNAEPHLIDAAALLLAKVTSDRPDGLISTLVTDERGIALGLVYSNLESVRESLRLGRGVYWSRKRGLWYKGETSGDIQELKHVSSDCDHDCLRFTVNQKGRGKTVTNAPCHSF